MKKAFYLIFGLFLTAILGIVIYRPQNNMIPARMFLYMLVWVGILSGVWFVLGRMEGVLVKIRKIALPVCVIGFGAALYLVSVLLKSFPVTDYKRVYDMAYALSYGGELPSWEYFSMWTNNLGPLTILTGLMKTARLLGFSDPYYFVLAVNCLQVMAAALSVFYLSGRMEKGREKSKWMGMLFFMMWTPVWAGTNGFYSDQLSFGGGVIALALLMRALDERQGERKLFVFGRIFLAGVIGSLAVYAKATAGIVWIAGAIVYLFFADPPVRKRGRQNREILLFCAVAVLCFSLFALHDRSYPSRQDEQRLKTPTEFWVAMGLLENGSYSDNLHFVKKCNYEPNFEKRRAFCRQIIRENIGSMWEWDHVREKTSVIFGEGSILPTSVEYPDTETILWEWVHWEGRYFWKYCCLSTGFFYAVLLLLIAGCAAQFLEKKPDNLVFWIYLTVFGMFLFLSLWEAQNKQLYNHIPWMTLAALHGLGSIEHGLKRWRGK